MSKTAISNTFSEALTHYQGHLKSIARTLRDPFGTPPPLVMMSRDTIAKTPSQYLVGSDADYGGQSRASLDQKLPDGTARFHGTLNRTVPDKFIKLAQAEEKVRSGYAGFRSRVSECHLWESQGIHLYDIATDLALEYRGLWQDQLECGVPSLRCLAGSKQYRSRPRRTPRCILSQLPD